MEQLEFHSFLLHLGNELESNEFEALKFVLKGYVTSSKCEEMVQVFKYFEEMERLCLLSPKNFVVLKIALGSIGRLDLVEKIEGKEEFFASLFRETINNDNSLDRKDCDLVCDDIKEAAVHLADFFPRSGQSTSEMHKKLKLIGGEKDTDFQLQEIVEDLQASAEDEQMTDGSYLEDFNTSKTSDKMKTAVTTGATSPHATMLASFSSAKKPDDNVVTDGGDQKGNKGNVRAGFNKLDEETTMNSSKQGNFKPSWPLRKY